MKRKSAALIGWIVGIAMTVSVAAVPAGYAFAAENTVFINEIESKDEAKGPDWVEIMNIGPSDVDISGYVISDEKGLANLDDGSTAPISDGTILKAGETMVLEENRDFSFGLGKADTANLYDAGGSLIDTYSWSAHAAGTYGRQPDGTGEFKDGEPTKGKLNTAHAASGGLVINEINSSPDDWVEFINTSDREIDISGFEVRDNSDDHRWLFPDGTKVASGGMILVTAKTEGLVFDNGGNIVGATFESAIGIGSGDSIRLYGKDGTILDQYTWTEHASMDGDAAKASFGRYPDGTGEFTLMPETPNAPNGEFTEEPEDPAGPPAEAIKTIKWPGPDEVTAFDKDSVFFEDSSGLDFSNGKLYAVDNGTATFWILDASKDGSLKFAKGFEKGRRVIFQKDAAAYKAAGIAAKGELPKGPDAEGITVDGSGMIYLAVERDNSDKGTNFDCILMADPNTDSENIIAAKEWNITDKLPAVSANMGIESVEWVPNSEIAGKIIDANTGMPFSPANYPNAHADGVFFTALEDNGHVYAFVLNEDGTSELIADLDSRLGGAMALDYDAYENILWIAADDGYGNKAARMTFNGTASPEVVHVLPPAGVDASRNNEGFAIADASYTMNGKRPVYRFADGFKSQALTVGYIASSYKAPSGEAPGAGSTQESPKAPTASVISGDTPGAGPQPTPGTGDKSELEIYAAMLAASLALGSYALIARRNKKAQ